MVGSTIQAIFGDFRQFVDDHFLSPPALLIAIGFILLFVATLGAYGAIKESVMLINLVSLILNKGQRMKTTRLTGDSLAPVINFRRRI